MVVAERREAAVAAIVASPLPELHDRREDARERLDSGHEVEEFFSVLLAMNVAERSVARGAQVGEDFGDGRTEDVRGWAR